MNKIRQAFENGKAFIPFITCGDPDVETTMACVREMVRLGQEYGGQWLCAGKCSHKGHPHHPLYLRKDEKVRPFDIEGYLNSL